MLRHAVLLVLLAPCLLPAAAADAATPGDAPNAWRDAWDAAPGILDGSLPQRDADWYRVQVPAGQAAVIQFHSGAVHLEARTDAGELLARTEMTYYPLVVTGSPDGYVRFGVVNDWFEDATYWAEISLTPASNVSVVSLRVEDDTIMTELGPSAPAPHKVVVVDVLNQGPLVAEGTTIQAWAEHPGQAFGGHRAIGSAVATLAAGERRSFRFTWDATGEVGAVDLVASAWPHVEANPLDNVQHVRTHALADLDEGIDALNLEASTLSLYYSYPYASLATHYGSGEKGISWNAVGSYYLLWAATSGRATTREVDVNACAPSVPCI